MTKDTRTYITLHDGMPQNRKIRPLSDKAFRTIIELWCWCAQERNDGAMDEAAFKTFGTPKARAELIERGLIERVGEAYQAHDYLEHQRSRAQIEELSRVRSEAGRKGGRPAKPKHSETKEVSKSEAKKTQRSESDTDTDEDDDDQSSRGNSRAVIHSGDDPVSNSLVSKVVDVVGRHGITIHPLVVPDLIEFIEQRRGPGARPIQAVDRYFPNAINASWPEVEQFIHQKGLAS